MKMSRRQLLESMVLACSGLGPALFSDRAEAAIGGAAVWHESNGPLEVSIDENGNYDILAFGKRWFSCSNIGLHLKGVWYFNTNQTLDESLVADVPGREKKTLVQQRLAEGAFMPLEKVRESSASGSDHIGTFRSHSIVWKAMSIFYPKGLDFETSIRIYDKPSCIVFKQSFPHGATGLSLKTTPKRMPQRPGLDWPTNAADATTAFPSIHADSIADDISYLSFCGCMSHPQRGQKLDGFIGGTEAGVPLVLHDHELNTLVLSPLSHFANAVQVKSNSLLNSLVCGVSGRVTTLPAGYAHETILFAGKGVNQTMFDWGSQLLKIGGKSRSSLVPDKTLSHLGYWTDNGAYYYYNTEQGKDYQDTMLHIADYLKENEIPAKYLQLDSWWYFKGKDEGVSLWEPRPDVFPDGLNNLHSKTGLPFAAHNRYWSAENEYRSQYAFRNAPTSALPVADDFWHHIMDWAHKNNILLYEQDWLNVTYERLPALQTDVTLGEKWLRSMEVAARNCGLSIMYCMALPSHYLASTAYQAVTQIRASDDYCPGSNQWKIGLNSMLAWALGLAPFKDVFWSSETQPGSPYNKGNVTEPNFELQALVSALSTGAVGPGDKIGSLNKELIMKTCRQDGMLLKPDKPATTIDRCFQPNGPAGEVWSTYTKMGADSWQFVLIADQPREYLLTAADLGLSSPYLALDTESGATTSIAEKGSLKVGASSPPRSGAVPFQYFVLAPLTGDGVAFIGEANKFVTVSKQRFKQVSDGGKKLVVTGAPGEIVELTWKCQNAPASLKVEGIEVPMQQTDWQSKSSPAASANSATSLKLPKSAQKCCYTHERARGLVKLILPIPSTLQVHVQIGW
jgi:hypothetical protein